MRKILEVKFHEDNPLKPILKFEIDHFPPYSEGQVIILDVKVEGHGDKYVYVISEIVHTIVHVKMDVGSGAIQDWQRFSMIINVKHQSTLGK